jgi:enoyl-CoA hydratase/carnithine racemase
VLRQRRARTALTPAAAALDALEADPEVRGVIIASGVKKDIFTAGCATAEAFSLSVPAEPLCAR